MKDVMPRASLLRASAVSLGMAYRLRSAACRLYDTNALTDLRLSCGCPGQCQCGFPLFLPPPSPSQKEVGLIKAQPEYPKPFHPVFSHQSDTRRLARQRCSDCCVLLSTAAYKAWPGEEGEEARGEGSAEEQQERKEAQSGG
eukprot:1572911-Rhodomonas_salina.3